MKGILDSPKRKSIKFRIKELLPLILIFGLFILSVFLQITDFYILYLIDYIAFSAAFASFLLYFINRKAYIFMLALILALGTINLFTFTPFRFSFNFGIYSGDAEGVFTFGIQPIPLILLCIHLFIFKNDLKPSQKEKNDVKTEVISSFKSKFKNKNLNELEIIASGVGYREEAMQAAIEIIEERKIKLRNK